MLRARCTIVPIGFCLSMYGMLLVLLQPILHGATPLIRGSTEGPRPVRTEHRSGLHVTSTQAEQPAGLPESIACLLGLEDIAAFKGAYDRFSDRFGPAVNERGVAATKNYLNGVLLGHPERLAVIVALNDTWKVENGPTVGDDLLEWRANVALPLLNALMEEQLPNARPHDAEPDARCNGVRSPEESIVAFLCEYLASAATENIAPTNSQRYMAHSLAGNLIGAMCRDLGQGSNVWDEVEPALNSSMFSEEYKQRVKAWTPQNDGHTAAANVIKILRGSNKNSDHKYAGLAKSLANIDLGEPASLGEPARRRAEQAADFAATGGDGTFAVSVNGDDPKWTATTDSKWISLTTASGTGSGTLAYTVEQNSLDIPRTGVITVAGDTHTVTQAQASRECIAEREAVSGEKDEVESELRAIYDRSTAMLRDARLAMPATPRYADVVAALDNQSALLMTDEEINDVAGAVAGDIALLDQFARGPRVDDRLSVENEFDCTLRVILQAVEYELSGRNKHYSVGFIYKGDVLGPDTIVKLRGARTDLWKAHLLFRGLLHPEKWDATLDAAKPWAALRPLPLLRVDREGLTTKLLEAVVLGGYLSTGIRIARIDAGLDAVESAEWPANYGAIAEDNPQGFNILLAWPAALDHLINSIITNENTIRVNDRLTKVENARVMIADLKVKTADHRVQGQSLVVASAITDQQAAQVGVEYAAREAVQAEFNAVGLGLEQEAARVLVEKAVSGLNAGLISLEVENRNTAAAEYALLVLADQLPGVYADAMLAQDLLGVLKDGWAPDGAAARDDSQAAVDAYPIYLASLDLASVNLASIAASTLRQDEDQQAAVAALTGLAQLRYQLESSLAEHKRGGGKGLMSIFKPIALVVAAVASVAFSCPAILTLTTLALNTAEAVVKRDWQTALASAGALATAAFEQLPPATQSKLKKDFKNLNDGLITPVVEKAKSFWSAMPSPMQQYFKQQAYVQVGNIGLPDDLKGFAQQQLEKRGVDLAQTVTLRDALTQSAPEMLRRIDMNQLGLNGVLETPARIGEFIRMTQTEFADSVATMKQSIPALRGEIAQQFTSQLQDAGNNVLNEVMGTFDKVSGESLAQLDFVSTFESLQQTWPGTAEIKRVMTQLKDKTVAGSVDALNTMVMNALDADNTVAAKKAALLTIFKSDEGSRVRDALAGAFPELDIAKVMNIEGGVEAIKQLPARIRAQTQEAVGRTESSLGDWSSAFAAYEVMTGREVRADLRELTQLDEALATIGEAQWLSDGDVTRALDTLTKSDLVNSGVATKMKGAVTAILQELRTHADESKASEVADAATKAVKGQLQRLLNDQSRLQGKIRDSLRDAVERGMEASAELVVRGPQGGEPNPAGGDERSGLQAELEVVMSAAMDVFVEEAGDFAIPASTASASSATSSAVARGDAELIAMVNQGEAAARALSWIGDAIGRAADNEGELNMREFFTVSHCAINAAIMSTFEEKYGRTMEQLDTATAVGFERAVGSGRSDEVVARMAGMVTQLRDTAARMQLSPEQLAILANAPPVVLDEKLRLDLEQIRATAANALHVTREVSSSREMLAAVHQMNEDLKNAKQEQRKEVLDNFFDETIKKKLLNPVESDLKRAIELIGGPGVDLTVASDAVKEYARQVGTIRQLNARLMAACEAVESRLKKLSEKDANAVDKASVDELVDELNNLVGPYTITASGDGDGKQVLQDGLVGVVVAQVGVAKLAFNLGLSSCDGIVEKLRGAMEQLRTARDALADAQAARDALAAAQAKRDNAPASASPTTAEYAGPAPAMGDAIDTVKQGWLLLSGPEALGNDYRALASAFEKDAQTYWQTEIRPQFQWKAIAEAMEKQGLWDAVERAQDSGERVEKLGALVDAMGGATGLWGTLRSQRDLIYRANLERLRVEQLVVAAGAKKQAETFIAGAADMRSAAAEIGVELAKMRQRLADIAVETTKFKAGAAKEELAARESEYAAAVLGARIATLQREITVIETPAVDWAERDKVGVRRGVYERLWALLRDRVWFDRYVKTMEGNRNEDIGRTHVIAKALQTWKGLVPAPGQVTQWTTTIKELSEAARDLAIGRDVFEDSVDVEVELGKQSFVDSEPPNDNFAGVWVSATFDLFPSKVDAVAVWGNAETAVERVTLSAELPAGLWLQTVDARNVEEVLVRHQGNAVLVAPKSDAGQPEEARLHIATLQPRLGAADLGASVHPATGYPLSGRYTVFIPKAIYENLMEPIRLTLVGRALVPAN